MFTLAFASMDQLCLPPRRKLGCIREIDYRTKVGNPAWYIRNPLPRVRKLSASRRAHMQRSHGWVQRELKKRGYTGEDYGEIPVPEWVKIVETFKKRDARRGITR